MADAWGGSWGDSWGESWGTDGVVVQPVRRRLEGPAGGGRHHPYYRLPYWWEQPEYLEPERTPAQVAALLAEMQRQMARVDNRAQSEADERHDRAVSKYVRNPRKRFDDRFGVAFGALAQKGWKPK